MRKFILVDDLVLELNHNYKEQMTDFCLTPLGIENWLLDRALYPIQLHIHSKERPDPELDDVIAHLNYICASFEQLHVDYFKVNAIRNALRYLEQLRLLKGEYTRIFFEEDKDLNALAERSAETLKQGQKASKDHAEIS